jgi:hypothetical protein
VFSAPSSSSSASSTYKLLKGLDDVLSLVYWSLIGFISLGIEWF